MIQLWLASSDLSLIERWMPTGVFAGVITNPKVVADAAMPAEKLFRSLCAFGPAWYQLRDAEPAAMLEEARRMTAVNPERMRIKVPATVAGLQVIRRLREDGAAEVMATCVPTAAWMVFAVAAGATYIAPYGGMLQKRGIVSKADEVARMQAILDRQRDNQGQPARLCVGVYDVTELPFYAGLGVRACFVWGHDVERFLTQPLVQEAAGGFTGDWSRIESQY